MPTLIDAFRLIKSLRDAHDALRTYSIYDADPERGTLDIVIFGHAGDPPTPVSHRFRSGRATPPGASG